MQWSVVAARSPCSAFDVEQLFEHTFGVSFTPSKRDKWPPPRQWKHVWIRQSRAPHPAPYAGLVLAWRGPKWEAWTVWVDERDQVHQGWLPAAQLRPAMSDWNVWNDGPWR
jgi:hypothetical protein